MRSKRSPDVFDLLLNDQTLPSEIKQLIFEDYLTMEDRARLSLINKSSHDFYANHISKVVLNGIRIILQHYDLMQMGQNTLTAKNFWHRWSRKNNIVTSKMLSIADKLAAFLREDCPTVWDRDGLVEWLVQTEIQAIKSVEFWQIALYKVLLNMGVEVTDDERHIKIVTRKNLKIAKEFILSQYRLQGINLPRNEFRGLRAVINDGGVFNYQREVSAITELYSSFEQLGLVKLAKRFMQRMKLSYLRDGSKEIEADRIGIVREYRESIDNLIYLLIENNADYANRELNAGRQFSLNEVDEVLKDNHYFYFYDQRSVKEIFRFLPTLTVTELLQFVKGYELRKDQLDLDAFLLLKKVVSLINYFAHEEYYGEYIKKMFDEDHNRIDFILKLIHMHGVYLQFTESGLRKAFKETFNLYTMHAKGVYIEASVLQQTWFYFNVEGITSDTRQNATKFFTMLQDVVKNQKLYKRLQVQLVLLNPVTALDFINQVPRAYEQYPELVKRLDFDSEEICFELPDDSLIGSGLTLFDAGVLRSSGEYSLRSSKPEEGTAASRNVKNQ